MDKRKIFIDYQRDFIYLCFNCNQSYTLKIVSDDRVSRDLHYIFNNAYIKKKYFQQNILMSLFRHEQVTAE